MRMGTGIFLSWMQVVHQRNLTHTPDTHELYPPVFPRVLILSLMALHPAIAKITGLVFALTFTFS